MLCPILFGTAIIEDRDMRFSHFCENFKSTRRIFVLLLFMKYNAKTKLFTFGDLISQTHTGSFWLVHIFYPWILEDKRLRFFPYPFFQFDQLERYRLLKMNITWIPRMNGVYSDEYLLIRIHKNPHLLQWKFSILNWDSVFCYIFNKYFKIHCWF